MKSNNTAISTLLLLTNSTVISCLQLPSNRTIISTFLLINKNPAISKFAIILVHLPKPPEKISGLATLSSVFLF